MRARREPKIVDPITFDYVIGILNIIQSRSKSERSFNAQQGSIGLKQREECKKFKEVFETAKMSDNTLIEWFKTMYDMMNDIFEAVGKQDFINFQLKSSHLTTLEKVSAVIGYLKRGLDIQARSKTR